jgi:DNA polymerase III sliding clamp (beta) subunit (PCNA family)
MISLPVCELKPVLAGLAQAVPRRARLDCLRCVRVEATGDGITLAATDLDVHVRAVVPVPEAAPTAPFLVPFEELRATVRRLPPRATLGLAPGLLAYKLAGRMVREAFSAPEAAEFPDEPVVQAVPAPLPDAFASRLGEAFGCASDDPSRHVLNGVHLDTSDPGCHCLVGTDGRHLYSANSFTLPLAASLTLPGHRFLAWRGLRELPWAVASESHNESTHVRLLIGAWTVTVRAAEGNFPNWRIVLPKPSAAKTTVTLPDEHDFARIVRSLPGADDPNKPVLLAVAGGTVAVGTARGDDLVPLVGASARGPDLRISLNRDYLAKAFDYRFDRIALIDPRSPLHFTGHGRQMVVMPLRCVEPAEPPKPAPTEPQPERKPMTQTTNGKSATNGAARSDAKPDDDKPTIDAAIERVDSLKSTLREALNGLTDVATLLRQSVREQRAGEREIQQVRQTLRSLQSVRI